MAHRTPKQIAATRKLVALNKRKANGKANPSKRKPAKRISCKLRRTARNPTGHRTAAQKAATRALVARNRAGAKPPRSNPSKRKAASKGGHTAKGHAKGNPGKRPHKGHHRRSRSNPGWGNLLTIAGAAGLGFGASVVSALFNDTVLGHRSRSFRTARSLLSLPRQSTGSTAPRTPSAW